MGSLYKKHHCIRSKYCIEFIELDKMVALSYCIMMIFGRKKVGKVGTGGAQQIAKENVETITFYGIMMLVANVIYFLIMGIPSASYQSTEFCMVLLAILIYCRCFVFLFRHGIYPNRKGKLIDLNMDNIVIICVKETIEWTMIAQILSILSNYFWPILFIGPIRFLWMVWISIKPCISAKDYSLQYQTWKKLLEDFYRKENIAIQKIGLASEIPEEPPVNEPTAVRIIIKLPEGQRLERRFHKSQSLKYLYYYVFCHPDSPDEFDITTNFPRKVLDCKPAESADHDPPSFEEAGLGKSTMLFVNDLEA